MLYGSVSQGLGTIKFMNLIGWKRYWKRSRFSRLNQHGIVLQWKSCKLNCKNIDYFHLTIFIYGSAKFSDEKKSKEGKQTSAELNSTSNCCSQAKYQLVQTNHIKQIKLFLFAPYDKHLIYSAYSACIRESWPRSCVLLCSVCTHDLGQDSPTQTSSLVNKS